jgi:hypothetical protein
LSASIAPEICVGEADAGAGGAIGGWDASGIWGTIGGWDASGIWGTIGDWGAIEAAGGC